ncbi:MAG: hypothetical protein KTR30_09545 [Saprospiraceae bacterium]|nr:hypothetical protein [Saprospiraceae bacterium]
MNRLLLCIFCLLAIRFSAAAQEAETEQDNAPYHIFFSPYFQVGLPQEVLRTNIDRVGYGGGGVLVFQIQRLPVFAGVDVTFLNFDRESERYNDNTEWTSRTNLFMGHGVLRFQPFVDFPIYPYFDALFGVKHFYARTTVEFLDTDESDSSGNGSDTALSYGFAAGAQFAIFGNPGITMDFRCSYLPGNNATYFARDPAANGPFDDPIEAFQRRTSPTPVLLLQLGVTFNLNDPYFDM